MQVPINKNLYSASYILITGGISGGLLTLLPPICPDGLEFQHDPQHYPSRKEMSKSANGTSGVFLGYLVSRVILCLVKEDAAAPRQQL